MGDKLDRYFHEYFDKILIDAPCSGEGMFRKHEEACSEWSPENVELCAKRQDNVLDKAAAMLKKGGSWYIRPVRLRCRRMKAVLHGSFCGIRNFP